MPPDRRHIALNWDLNDSPVTSAADRSALKETYTSWTENDLQLLTSGPRRGQRSDPGWLCHHVLLPFVEADLAERHGAHRHVDPCGDEAVDADLVVETVDVPGRILTAGEKKRRVNKTVRLKTFSWSQTRIYDEDSFNMLTEELQRSRMTSHHVWSSCNERLLTWFWI